LTGGGWYGAMGRAMLVGDSTSSVQPTNYSRTRPYRCGATVGEHTRTRTNAHSAREDGSTRRPPTTGHRPIHTTPRVEAVGYRDERGFAQLLSGMSATA